MCHLVGVIVNALELLNLAVRIEMTAASPGRKSRTPESAYTSDSDANLRICHPPPKGYKNNTDEVECRYGVPKRTRTSWQDEKRETDEPAGMSEARARARARAPLYGSEGRTGEKKKKKKQLKTDNVRCDAHAFRCIVT